MQYLEPIDLGIVDLNLKAILQPKGFFKVIEFLIAILTFSLTAGFSGSATFRCQTNSNLTEATVASAYPFDMFYFQSYINGTKNSSYVTDMSSNSSTPQFFVAWGVFTMFYCIIAVLVYTFLTGKFKIFEKLPGLLVYIDLISHVVWIFITFVAFLAWAIVSHNIRNQLYYFVSACAPRSTDLSTFAQIDISLLFCFLSLVLWCANIYFVLKDTDIFIDWLNKRKQNYSPSKSASQEVY